MALASFVQSLPTLPPTVFTDANIHKSRSKDINTKLREIYEAVRAVIRQGKCQEKEAWVALSGNNWDVALAVATFAPKAPETPPTTTVAKPAPAPQPPTHFTGPLLDMPLFWKEEVEARAALLNLDRGFLAKSKTTLRARLLKWVEKAGDFYLGTPLQYIPVVDRDDEVARVIIKDAERTFYHRDHQEKMVAFLYSVYHEFHSYGQAMSYFAGICLLGLNEQETVAVLRKVAKEYIPNHWAGEAFGFATNAWVFEYILRSRDKEVADHFNKLNFWPDTYLQKILSGLCIHVLIFEQLFDFLDRFVEQGLPFLFKFGLAVVEHFRAELMAISKPEQISEMYELLRLDAKNVDPSETKVILERATKLDLGSVVDELTNLRMRIYDEKIAPRRAKAPKGEAFEPCEKCEKAKPVWFCDECACAICDACHKANVKGHLASHSVEKF